MKTEELNMRHSTPMIIEALRADGEPKLLLLAADRLEELQRELTETLRERYKTVAELTRQRDEANAELIKQRDEAKVTHADDLSAQMLTLISGMNAANAPQVRPEPSRLEIAAMWVSGIAGYNKSHSYSREHVVKQAFINADALIAAAKEGGK